MPAQSNVASYLAISRIFARDIIGQGSRVFAWFVSTLAIAGITMALYATAYQAASPALPLEAALWSLAIGQLLRLTWRHLCGTVTERVRSGSIALSLRYPLPFFGAIFAQHFGWSAPAMLSAPLMFALAWLIGGSPTVPQPLLAIPLALTMVVLSVVLSATMYTMVGLLSFWIEDAEPILWLLDKTGLVLSGSVVPLALLPGTARSVIEYVPLAAVGFPAQVVNPDFLDDAWRLLAIEAGWTTVAVVALALMWRRAVRQLEVNGG